MKHLIFSPLAVICALSVLYPSPEIKTEEIEWFDSFEEINNESEDLFSLLEFDEEAETDLAVTDPFLQTEIDEDANETVVIQVDELGLSEEDQEIEEIASIPELDESAMVANDDDSEDDEEDTDGDEDDTDSSEETDDDQEDSLSAAPESMPAPNYPRPRSSNPFSNNSEAITPKPSAPQSVHTPIPTSSVGIGASYSYVHFRPTNEAAFHGNLAGAQGLFEYRPTSGFYSALKLNWREGITKSTNGVSRHLTDALAEERIGFTVHSNNRLCHLSIFSGLGFHYSNQKLHQPGANSMRFIYNQFYCPLGFFSDYRFFHWFSVGLTGVWMPQVFPTLTISPIGGTRWETTLGLQNALVEVPITFYVGGKTQFFFQVKPTFQFWQDGKTTAKTTTGIPLGIPKNTYYFVGAEVNMGCAF